HRATLGASSASRLPAATAGRLSSAKVRPAPYNRALRPLDGLAAQALGGGLEVRPALPVRRDATACGRPPERQARLDRDRVRGQCDQELRRLPLPLVTMGVVED